LEERAIASTPCAESHILLGWSYLLIVKFKPAVSLIWPYEAVIMPLVQRPTVNEYSVKVIEVPSTFDWLITLLRLLLLR
jgi:hypothetical protein